MSDPVRIGILGDYEPKSPTLPAIEKSLQHASAHLNLPVEAEWIATPTVLAPEALKKLESYDGIWAAPGSPYKSFDGMLKGIVGFAMPIARLEGKWKMSQNRPAEDRAGVISGLEAEQQPEVADLILR